ncbi:hypothetical protein L249_3292 [Ophiocordyceps polyrhachis-furcata BCC 54312]|uniref:Core domain-containing protein n=1 Tax=Ophiocordyceps polyrhachis-furcata BCC 54312 TaxID=1330021 RepID=A0A367LQH2_9HYPO|nr:hypothetical protein L249_3292 [Ophiocordyceps polyrhachis-furcata BCC 54312]
MTPFHCAQRTTVARTFVQLASRCHFTTTAWPTTTKSFESLDFLFPRGAVRARGLHTASRPRLKISRSGDLSADIASPRLQHRSFVASATRNATKCVLHPRKDDDGNDMKLEITPRAATRLSQIKKKDNNPDLALRIQVESGGCHGFQYLISLVNVPGRDARDWSSVVAEDDSVFQYYSDAVDASTGTDQPIVILDEPSLQLLKGSKVDFTMELIGSQFKIVDNPFATSSCGCGTSFDIKL